MNNLLRITTKIFLAVALLCSLCTLKAQTDDIIVTTAEGVGVFNSTLSGTSVENFENIPIGVNDNVVWSGVGTIDKVSLVAANQYGGVGYNPYPVESSSSSLGGVQDTTITLKQNSSYFGFYWSAGDAANYLNFYNGNNLVASFSTASLMDKLPSSYYGNPNTPFLGQDKNEPFGFINFYADGGTSWNKIVLSDPTTSGFESDDWTTRVNGWNPTVDGALDGSPVVLLQNNNGTMTTTDITGVTTTGNQVSVATASGAVNFIPAAPGAPAPPLGACVAFAGVLILQALRRSGRGA